MWQENLENIPLNFERERMTKKENLVSTIKRNNPKWVPFRYDGSITFIIPDIVTQREEGGLDDWGTNWLYTVGKEGNYADEKPVIDIDEVDKIKVPDTDFKHITEDLNTKMKSCLKKDTLCIVKNELVLFQRAQLILGTEKFLMSMLLHPKKVGILLDVITDYQMKLTESIMRSGVPGIRFTDDWGIQNSLIIRPVLWRKLIKPRMKNIFKIVKKHDGLIFHHSCGHVEEIIPDLIDMGVDVIDPCQPASNDVLSWKKKYGDKLSFMGGLDTQGYLSFDTPQSVKKKVKEFVSLMSIGGGYIAAPSHTISIPDENRAAMVEAINEINKNRF